MFYDLLSKLCAENGISISALLENVGVDRSAASRWKKGTEPSNQTKKKLADYFGITVSELMTGEIGQKEKFLVNEDEELTEYLEMLRTRPEMKMLFQLSSKATKEDVEKAVKIIEAFLSKD